MTHLAMLVVFVIAVLGLAAYCSNQFAEECAAKGGHTKYVYKSTLCITADGRIIE